MTEPRSLGGRCNIGRGVTVTVRYDHRWVYASAPPAKIGGDVTELELEPSAAIALGGLLIATGRVALARMHQRNGGGHGRE